MKKGEQIVITDGAYEVVSGWTEREDEVCGSCGGPIPDYYLCTSCGSTMDEVGTSRIRRRVPAQTRPLTDEERAAIYEGCLEYSEVKFDYYKSRTRVERIRRNVERLNANAGL